jgi:hypothetical protein
VFLAFQLLDATSAPAQGPQPSTPPGAPPPFSDIARNVVTWLHHVTRTGTHRHRIASSPPLPRPRPAQLTKAPELPATAVEPNEAQPVSAAVEPKFSPAPAPKVEPDKAPTEPPAAAFEPNVRSTGRANTAAERDRPPGDLPAAAFEPNEAQPTASAVEPKMISSTPKVEPDKTPAELPSGAVEQTKAPNTPAGAVLQGANIPD